MKLAHVGAALYAAWGLLHIVAGIEGLFAIVAGGADAGFAAYTNASGPHPEVAGAILAMNAFITATVGALVLVVAAARNLRNSPDGAIFNLTLAGMLEAALLVFVVMPGFSPLSEAIFGQVLLGGAAFFSLLALHDEPRNALDAAS